MNLIRTLTLFVALFLTFMTFAQESPTYKEGERMSDGMICHQGVLVCIKQYPDRTCDWGCDLDKDRTLHRALEQRERDRVIREQEWEKLKQKGIVPLK